MKRRREGKAKSLPVRESPRPGSFAAIRAEAEALLAEAAALPPPQLTWTSRVPADGGAREAPANRWVVAMEPWLVNAGAFGALLRGREIDFALRWEPLVLEPAEIGAPRALFLGDEVYHVEARVLHRHDDLCAVDFGLLGFVSRAPEWMQAGTTLAGEVAMAVDPDLYRSSSRFGLGEAFPALIYPWRIDRIVREDAARIPATPEDCGRWNNPELQTNDPVRRGFRELEVATYAWGDTARDRMARFYVHCTLLSRIPRCPDESDRHPRHDRLDA